MSNTLNSTQSVIEQMYEAGASLDSIIIAVGTDPEIVKLVAYRLGLSTKPGSKLDWAVRRAQGVA